MWHMYLFLLLLPFSACLPHAGLWLGMGIGGILVLQYFNGSGQIKTNAVLPHLVLLLALSYLLGGVGSEWLQGILRCAAILLFFPFFDFFSNRERREKGKMCLQLSALVVSLFGLLQYFMGSAPLDWVDISRFGDIGGRVTSIFSNPNVLATYLLLVFPFSVEGFFQQRNRMIFRLFSFFSTTVTALCLLFTWSRGAWLGGLFSVILLCLLYGKQSRKSLLYAAPVVLLSLVFLPSNVINRFESIGNMGESSVRYRLYVWKGTVKMLMGAPWGVGMGDTCFSRSYLPYAVSGTESVMHTHQILMQVMSDTGYVGALLFIAAIVCMFLHVYRRRSGEDRSAVVAFCALLGCLCMGLFDHIWYQFGNMALFWIIFALAAQGKEKEET